MTAASQTLITELDATLNKIPDARQLVILKRVTGWMENHAILAVALPAILPPPMPLSAFVLAAGALNMSRKKFLNTFTISRALRHSIAAWLGIEYGRAVIRLWNRLSDQYATTKSQNKH